MLRVQLVRYGKPCAKGGKIASRDTRKWRRLLYSETWGGGEAQISNGCAEDSDQLMRINARSGLDGKLRWCAFTDCARPG
jgi:hypothetical protein